MLPEAFLDRMRKMLGAEYEIFIQCFEGERYQALRRNPNKIPRGGALPFHMTHVSWEKNGYYYSPEDQPGRHPYHEAGVYYIQEPSAMAVVPLLGARPGERVLDLCAAPGGKSTQIAARMEGKGLLVCNEIHPARAGILSENIERMGVTNVCVINEKPTRLSDAFSEYFDRILVDAPCSGEGMFRKNETACAEWSPENVALCAARQDEILDHAAKMLRPGGRLVYSTCTFAPEEDEGSIYRFLKRHPEFEILPIDKERLGLPEGACDGRPEWACRGGENAKDFIAENTAVNGTGRGDSTGESAATEETATDKQDMARIGELAYTLRLWPHHVKGEGHFAAVLKKAGSVPKGYAPTAAGGLEKGISGGDRALDDWWEFWHDLTGNGRETGIRRCCIDAAGDTVENVTGDVVEDVAGDVVENVAKDAEPDRFLLFGDNLYLMPDRMPALKGLKVLRPGLHLGTIKKNRFEPSHALALALLPKHVRRVCDFSGEDDVLKAYLGGQTYPCDGEKGWYLVTVDGCGIGWGKLAGGIMKNHYPKGLRKG